MVTPGSVSAEEVVLSFAEEPRTAAKAAEVLLKRAAYNGEWVSVAGISRAAARVYWANRGDEEAARSISRAVVRYDASLAEAFVLALQEEAGGRKSGPDRGASVLSAFRELRRVPGCGIALVAAAETLLWSRVVQGEVRHDRWCELLRYVLDERLLKVLSRTGGRAGAGATKILLHDAGVEERILLLSDPRCEIPEWRWVWSARSLSVEERIAAHRARRK